MPRDAEFVAAETLLVALEDYYDVSDSTLEPIVPGHPVHAAVGQWRKCLPRAKLDSDASRHWDALRRQSKIDRDPAEDAARDFADLLKERYPALAEDWSEEEGGWFQAPPSESSRFAFGPVSGQLKQLENWMQHGDWRTLKKHNGRGSYYIVQEHQRLYSVWFSTQRQFEDVATRAAGENA